jgi:NAD+ synthase (glutamine-hydrolysing)
LTRHLGNGIVMPVIDSTELPFESLYRHGFARVNVCVPQVRVADVAFNTQQTIDLAAQCHDDGAILAVFPELGLTAYSNDDLFQQDALLDAALDGLAAVLDATKKLRPLVFVGLPVRTHGRIYNVAVGILGGSILGVTPKSYIPTYREFYEKRQFASGADRSVREIDLLGSRVPFGPDVIYQAEDLPGFTVHAEICEDVWVPIPPSTYAAMAGATVLVNLSASNITIGKADYRRSLGKQQSAKCIAAYLYTAAGAGESTTDLAWDGDAHIHENGHLLAEAKRFSQTEQIVSADIHLAALIQDRSRMTSFADNAAVHAPAVESIRRVGFALDLPNGEVPLRREIARFPYVPADSGRRDDRCYEAYSIQVAGLVQRLRAAKIGKLVVGVSGGLDSTQALIVSARAMDLLERPRTDILAYTMPGFATSDRTLENARALMQSLGVTAGEIDIRDACMQMFADIGHPFAQGDEVFDVTFENVQAGERTSHLFRLANLHGGIVVGTGDLSELALGWATYGVGDHMSHYAVNASVPKTLIQYLIRWIADSQMAGAQTSPILYRILDTEISPELIPERAAEAGGSGGEQPVQKSEQTIGPYELQDFNLYYVTRFGIRPSSVAYLAYHAWKDAGSGIWPDNLPTEKRNEYELAEIRKWLRVFLARFFGNTQFKRSCIPNGPKVGSGGSLSPRGDWRAPSDSSPQVWLDELDRNVP